MNYPCNERWFGVLDRCWRPVTSWGLGIATVLYAGRAVIGLSFEETYFGAIAAASGFAYLRRGQEKLATKEAEQ